VTIFLEQHHEGWLWPVLFILLCACLVHGFVRKLHGRIFKEGMSSPFTGCV